jgi:Mg-chelatase subunit ChlD
MQRKNQISLTTRTFTFTDGRNLEVTTEDLEYIFKGFRPRLMDYDTYKAIRVQLKKELAQYLHGELVHLSKVTPEVWYNYIKNMEHKSIQKGHTYYAKKDTPSGESESK